MKIEQAVCQPVLPLIANQSSPNRYNFFKEPKIGGVAVTASAAQTDHSRRCGKVRKARTFSIQLASPPSPVIDMVAYLSRGTCCIIALFLAAVVFQDVQSLNLEELDALQKIYDSNPALMATFGWTANMHEACSSNTTWNLTISCTKDHVSKVYVLVSNDFVCISILPSAPFLTFGSFSYLKTTS